MKAASIIVLGVLGMLAAALLVLSGNVEGGFIATLPFVPFVFGTALTADRDTRVIVKPSLKGYKMNNNTTIYKGSMVVLNSSGYAVPAASTLGNSRVIGVADEQVVSPSTDAAGDKTVRVRSGEVYDFAATSIAQAMVGQTMYVVDDQTFDEARGTASLVAGTLVERVSATRGKIFIPTPLPAAHLERGDNLILATGGTDPSSIEGDTGEYTGTASYQPVAIDLPLGGAVGGAGKKLAPVMGNVIDRATPAVISTDSMVAGLIGAYSLAGTSGSSYPIGAVLGQISDLVNDVALGAFVAFIDGDSGVTKAGAAFKAMSNNSSAGSGFEYGLDLFGAAHDGYSELAILKAAIRMDKEVCLLQGAGVPTDGAAGTGAGFAQIGSLYCDRTNGKLYINGGTKASPTWKLVTSAA